MQISRKDISTLIIGIRYERSFRISDIMGNIFDCVLRNPHSPFGVEFFPRYQERNSQDKALVNDETGYFLRISTSDIIFQYPILEEKGSLDKQLNWFQNDAVSFIIDKIFDDNNLQNIKRVGLMISHVIEEENIGGIVLSKLSDEIKKADQFNLSFGRKDATADGLTKKGVNDYVNRITTLKQIEEKKFDITLDYQYYFLPDLEKIKGWPINDFFSKAYRNLDEKFYNMVNQLINEMVGVK